LAGRKIRIVVRRLRRRRRRWLASVRVEFADAGRRRIAGAGQARLEVEGVGGALGPARLGVDADLEHVVDRVAVPVRIAVGVQQLHAPESLVVGNDAIAVEVAVVILERVADVPAVPVPGVTAVDFDVAQLTLGVGPGVGARPVPVFPGVQGLREGARLCGGKHQDCAQREPDDVSMNDRYGAAGHGFLFPRGK
jgi:hypothetical protein